MMFDADNPDWQRFELIKSMMKLKDYVYRLLSDITQKPERSSEYFLNIICLVKGYTYFNNKMSIAKKMDVKFLVGPQKMKVLFISAIERFLEIIKSEK